MPFHKLGAFEDATVEADEQDKDSASDVQRFIISDLSDIFISDIFMASIDWLGTYLLDLLGTFDFPSLSTSLVSYKTCGRGDAKDVGVPRMPRR